MVIGQAITSFTNLDDIARFNFNGVGPNPQPFSHSFLSYPSRFSSSSSSCSSSSLNLRPFFNSSRRRRRRHPLYPFTSYNYSSMEPLLSRSLDAAQHQGVSEGESPSTHDHINVFTAQNDEASRKSKVAIVGSGNWGSVAAKLIASNTIRLSNFHDEVRMWVYEETVPSGEKLTDSINRTNENVKYLPGVKLGKNVVADPDLENAVRDANMLVFVTPHQFIEGICKRLVGKVKEGVEAISLIKGMEVKNLKMEGPCMISSVISQQLNINCCVLMGANIAKEIAVENFSEATVGYKNNRVIAEKWVHLFTTPYFSVSSTEDVEGVELCGTLKNVVALAAGFVDGLEMGNNTKAAIMRLGLIEMKAFSKLLFPSVKDSTFLESCGVADLITTCLGGRNRKVAEAFARNGGKRSFDELEADMLQGQKLQGVLTSWEVYEVLRNRGLLESFPLFSTVHEICTGRLPPSALVKHCVQKPGLSGSAV